eukprot:11156051-Lingulodinium_polyedra.AAC.1
MRESWGNPAAVFNPVVAIGTPLTLAEMMGGALGVAPLLASLPASSSGSCSGGVSRTSAVTPCGFG